MLWEVLIKWKVVNPIFFPPPSSIWLTLQKNYLELPQMLIISLEHISLSYIVGSILGIILGLAIGYYSILEKTIGMILNLIFPIPKVTFFPLFILWFGINNQTIIAICIFSVFFTVYMYTFLGTRQINPDYVEVYKNLGGNDKNIMTKLILPSTLPHISAGLRYAIGRAIGTAIVTEMLIGFIGLGGYLWQATNLFRPELIVLIQILIVLIGLILFAIFDKLEMLFFPWIRRKTDD